MAARLQQSRDHLAVLMALLTVELDERRRAVEQHQLETLERERMRLHQLAEVQSLNRRLSQVASNLSRIVDGGETTESEQQQAPTPPPALPTLPLPRPRVPRAGLGPPIRPLSGATAATADDSSADLSTVAGLSDLDD